MTRGDWAPMAGHGPAGKRLPVQVNSDGVLKTATDGGTTASMRHAEMMSALRDIRCQLLILNVYMSEAFGHTVHPHDIDEVKI